VTMVSEGGHVEVEAGVRERERERGGGGDISARGC
jgi:hypothetical protein